MTTVIGVGADMPEKTDLILLAEVAQCAKLVRLDFDACADLYDGLSIFAG